MREKYNIKWILAQAKGEGLAFALLIAFVALSGVAVIAVSLFMKLFIDIATGQSAVPLLNAVLFAAVDLLVLGVSQVAVSVLQSRLYCHVELGLRQKMMRKLYSIPLLAYDASPPSLYLTRITMDVETIADFLSNTSVVGIISECLTFCISLVLIFILNWKMALVLLLIFPLFMLAMVRFGPKINTYNTEITNEEEKNRTLLKEYLDKQILFKAYGMRAFMAQAIQKQYARKQKQKTKLGALQGILAFMNNFMGVGMFVIALGFGAYLTLAGETTVGSLIAIVNLVSFYYGPFMHVSGWMSATSAAKVAAARIGDVLDRPEEPPVLQARSDLPQEAALDAAGISFGYVAGKPVLQNVDACFSTGAVNAVVGESGGGKSTLLKILMGLYTPGEGHVQLAGGECRVNGRDIREYVAYDSPDTAVFSGSIRENICMAAGCDEQKLEQVLEQVNLLGLVQAKGDGFAVVEGGKNLSSGQVRRISLARALYRGAKVLIFDEPTANLDAESVQEFWQSLQELKCGRVVIVATHDQAIINRCDRVFRLANGRLWQQ